MDSVVGTKSRVRSLFLDPYEEVLRGGRSVRTGVGEFVEEGLGPIKEEGSETDETFGVIGVKQFIDPDLRGVSNSWWVPPYNTTTTLPVLTVR